MNRRRLLGALCGCALALALAMGSARAASKPRVGVLRIEFEGKVPEVSQVFLSERLVEGLAGAGFEVSAGEMLKNALDKGATPESCRDESCYRGIAGRMALDYLVIATVRMSDKNYGLKLQLIAARTGRPAGDVGDKCELCGIQEVGEKLDRMASSLTAFVDATRAASARLTLLSQPAGASATVDGRAAGETPLSLELPAGAHEVGLAAPGHASARKQISLDPGVSEILSIDLVPLAPPPASRDAVPWRPMGLTAVAVGVAAIAGGAALLVLNGRDAECPAELMRQGYECRQNTRLPAGALLGGGGVAAVMGGLLLYFGWSAR